MFLFWALVFFKSFLGDAHELRTSELEAQGTQVGGKHRIADLGSIEEPVFLNKLTQGRAGSLSLTAGTHSPRLGGLKQYKLIAR